MIAIKINKLPGAYRVTHCGRSQVLLGCSNGAHAIAEYIKRNFNIVKVFALICPMGYIEIEAEDIFMAYDKAKAEYATFMTSGYELFPV